MNGIQHGVPAERRSGLLKSRAGIVLIVFLAIAAFYLITEHQAHLAGIWPWILIAACPLLHVFMHQGHGAHGGHGNQRNAEDR